MHLLDSIIPFVDRIPLTLEKWFTFPNIMPPNVNVTQSSFPDPYDQALFVFVFKVNFWNLPPFFTHSFFLQIVRYFVVLLLYYYRRYSAIATIFMDVHLPDRNNLTQGSANHADKYNVFDPVWIPL